MWRGSKLEVGSLLLGPPVFFRSRFFGGYKISRAPTVITNLLVRLVKFREKFNRVAGTGSASFWDSGLEEHKRLHVSCDLALFSIG